MLPADHASELHRGAGPERLVARRVGAVVQHPILHVDEPGEDELGQKLVPEGAVLLGLFPQPEEDAVGVHDLAALDERQPGVELLGEGAVDHERLLLGPVDFWQRRLALELQLVEPDVVTGHLAEELVPGIEPRGEVPDGLRQRQVRQLGPEQGHQLRARPRAQEAVVVVHELHHAVVEALVIGHVGVGRVDPDDLTHELG